MTKRKRKRAARVAARKRRRAAKPVACKRRRAAKPAARKRRRAVKPVARKRRRAAKPVARKRRRAAKPVARKRRRAAKPAARKRRRAAKPAPRKPFDPRHTTVHRVSEEIEKLGYYIVIHAAVMGGWATLGDYKQVFEDADETQYHLILWRTKTFWTIQEALDAFLDLTRVQLEQGLETEIGVEILWSELRIRYPDHTTLGLDRWEGNKVPYYGPV